MIKKHSKTEIEQALRELNGWTMVEGREAIFKKFKFSDFNQAFGWMTRIALMAEAMDHHPEWLNVWNRVEVTLTTHDAKGLTSKDIALATFMDEIA